MSEQPAGNLADNEQAGCEIPFKLAEALKEGNCGNQGRQGDVPNDGNTLTPSSFSPSEAATNEEGGEAGL
ncbi:MAG: hypothetical protein ACOX3T_07030 [Bdellovibrionota bacterium]